ncbi:MAG TPA: S8 family serine peptidase [Gaiellaceae bacterium]|nr:S8 family serine peptidase [Gaiellaceae bacterium]
MRWRDAASLVALAAIAVAAVLVAPAGGGGAASPRQPGDAAGWSGLVGAARAPVATGQRVLVVLSAFSLADRVTRAGGRASDADERRWTAAALAAQGQFISNLGAQGVSIRPEFRFTRTLNGFSATLDARAIAALERLPGVKGVYPVRVAYPAATGSTDRGGSSAAVRLAGIAGRGVTIALLDTGVDLHKASFRGHVLGGIDVLGGALDARAKAKPTDPAQLEAHGTEMAGVLLGVAPGASILPVRVAGWQADQRGDYAVYSRTDQLLAGLERAVDPNHDGDAHDAARVALVPLVEPFAAFGDSPLARAIDGAQRLDTLVVVAAGNDGPAGPAFGSVGGPAGAPDALTVGALDARGRTADVRVVVRAGLSVLFDRLVPLAGAIQPDRTLLLQAAAPRAPVSTQQAFFRQGASLVAGRAAIAPTTAAPEDVARWASVAGASAVVLHGRAVAPGAIATDERIDVPVVVLPDRIAKVLLVRRDALVAIAAPRAHAAAPNALAPFSSWGLAFDGGVKPELLAPGVGLATAEPGRAPEGGSAAGAVSGSSAAAAVVAGAAALLAEARPEADARTLHALLVGGGDRLGGLPVAAQGAGLLDLGRAAAAELVVDPPALTFGRGTGDGWHGRRVIRVRNVSSRRLTLFVDAGRRGKARVPISLSARRLELEPGATGELEVGARLRTVVRAEAASGTLTLTPVGGAAVRVPWAVVLRPGGGLLGPLALSRRAFKPSEQKPAIVLLRAGRVVRSPRGNEVVPVLRLDVELWTVGGKRLGLLARLRDLLPGRYAFGLTGHGPAGRLLKPGRYELRVLAYPTGGGAPSLQSTRFTITS